MLHHQQQQQQPCTTLLQYHPESDIKVLEDDWSGIFSADRRKIQNRINAGAVREFTEFMSSRVNI